MWLRVFVSGNGVSCDFLMKGGFVLGRLSSLFLDPDPGGLRGLGFELRFGDGALGFLCPTFYAFVLFLGTGV